jgi:hypothetical protein
MVQMYKQRGKFSRSAPEGVRSSQIARAKRSNPAKIRFPARPTAFPLTANTKEVVKKCS